MSTVAPATASGSHGIDPNDPGTRGVTGAPWGPLAWALGAGTAVYGALVVTSPHSPALLVAAVAMLLGALAAARSARAWSTVGACGIGFALTAVAVTLHRAGARDEARALLSLCTALSGGAASAIFVWLARWGRRGLASPPPMAQHAPGEPAAHTPRKPQGWMEQAAARWHGPALAVGLGAMALGEGAGFAGAGLFTAVALVRARHLDTRVLQTATARRVGAGLALLLGAGITAWIVGGHGPLRLRELGLYGPWFVTPAVAVSTASVPPRWRRRCVAWLVGGLTVSAFVALIQHFAGIQPDAELLWPFSEVSAHRQVWVPGSNNEPVAGGFFMHRLKLAHALLVALAVVTAGLVFQRRTSALGRVAQLLALALCGAALVFTYARGAWLAATLGVGATMVFAPARVRRLGLIASALLVAVALALPSVRQRVTSALDTQTSSDRALIWSQAVHILDNHPLGAGLGNYSPLVRARYEAVGAADVVPRTYAHSLVMSTWAEAGPLGLLGYAVMWLASLWACVAQLRRSAGRGPSPGEDDAATSDANTAAAAGLFVLTAMWFLGTTHDVFFHKPVALITAALFGWIAAMLSPSSQESAAPQTNATSN